MDDPTDVTVKSNEKSGAEISIPENVFLIFQGEKAIPLNQAIVSIGRGHDNIIVIDDPRVSRHHVEIRVIKDRFVIFDLQSTGGTYINGQRLNQGLLYQGDLISLAGINMVFIQDRQLLTRDRSDINQVGPGVHATAIMNPSLTNNGMARKKP